MTSLRGMDVPLSRVAYRFAEFEIDIAAYELRHGAQRVRLARQPMDLLLLLLERRLELVSRDEIAKQLWGPDVCIDFDAGIHTAILKIRQVLGDSRESPRFVETVPGKGYRFIAPVEVVAPPPSQASPTVSTAPDRLPETRRHNLPADLTSFVGRRKELVELPRAARVVAAAVADRRRRRRQDAAGDSTGARPRRPVPRRRLAGRSCAALGVRSGGADDRDRRWCPRRAAPIGARGAARLSASS